VFKSLLSEARVATSTILKKSAARQAPPDAAGDVGLGDLGAMLEVLLTRVVEAEVSTRLVAERHEPSDERTGTQNGTRDRSFDTPIG